MCLLSTLSYGNSLTHILIVVCHHGDRSFTSAISQHMHALTFLREQAKQLQIRDEKDDDDSDNSDDEMLAGDGDTLSLMLNTGRRTVLVGGRYW
jgi:hypothetical protein